ncbi:MAG: A/G-specific adenine glycosylase, partial [Clostridia bacterium]|nr:A/G-specific adenine glycosylase [Clostridia bacterium]
MKKKDLEKNALSVALVARAVPLLLAWYEGAKRPLPWRQSPTAYKVWISEIMLQQTRIEAVIPYYERFLSHLPDVAALAKVEESELLKLWEGLGYYSRARNLKKAAQTVMSDFGGSLPRTAHELETLAGIGPYTAGAIASIA